MGWGSGSAIFNAVARELIAARLEDHKIKKVLVALIQELHMNDWDTEDESLDAFEHPAVIEAFAEFQLYRPDDPRSEYYEGNDDES